MSPLSFNEKPTPVEPVNPKRDILSWHDRLVLKCARIGIKLFPREVQEAMNAYFDVMEECRILYLTCMDTTWNTVAAITEVDRLHNLAVEAAKAREIQILQYCANQFRRLLETPLIIARPAPNVKKTAW